MFLGISSKIHLKMSMIPLKMINYITLEKKKDLNVPV